MPALLLSRCLLLLPFSLASAHPGGLDVASCHTNKKTGDYHCHRDIPSVGDPQPTVKNLEAQRRRGIRVKDGDTIVLDGGEEVRFISVDTPDEETLFLPADELERQGDGHRAEGPPQKSV